jgi:hypothetical protein
MLGAVGHFNVPPLLVPLLWAGCCKNDRSLTPWQSFTEPDPLTVAAGAAVELLSGYGARWRLPAPPAGRRSRTPRALSEPSSA